VSFIHFVVNHGNRFASARFSEENWAAGRTTGAAPIGKLQDFFDFLLRDAVLRDVLHISIRIIIQIPDDRRESHRRPSGIIAKAILRRKPTSVQERSVLAKQSPAKDESDCNSHQRR
jgi:hypothetical protein